ncbi:hypothetical protein ACFX2K_023242 [Malus domestica]
MARVNWSSDPLSSCGNIIHHINKDDGRSILLGMMEKITNQGLDREEEDDDELKLEDSVSDGEPSDQTRPSILVRPASR